MKTICAAMIMVACLTGATKPDQPPTRPAQIKVHNINQVELCISNFGKFGQTTGGNVGLWWPRSSGHSYIFGDGFWFGTVDSTSGDTLVSIGYGPHGGETEFGPGLSGMPASDSNAIIFMYPDPWPPPPGIFPMAPQDPIAYQDAWCCFNDSNPNNHVPGDTRPIGIEVYQTVYVWNLAPIEDIAFMMYQIKNVSDHNLNDCYFGIITDNDIGNEAGSSANDRVTVIRNRSYCIAGDWYVADNIGYQWQEEPEPGWTEFPGTIGFALLQTGFDLQPGMDKDNDGIPDQYERDSSYYVNNLSQSMWDVDRDHVPDWRDASENPQIGLTAMKLFTLNLDPNKDNERYMTLAGYNFKTGEYCPFDTMPPEPDDMRCLLASGPFSIKPDSSIMLVFAIMFANWRGIYQKPDTAIVLVDKWAQLDYDMNYYRYTSVGEGRSEERTENNFMVLPNPVTTQGHIIFSVPTSEHIKIKLYNVLGQAVKMVAHGYFAAGKNDC